MPKSKILIILSALVTESILRTGYVVSKNWIQLVNESVWGGQVEIIALSRALKVKIRVLQAEAPNQLVFGDNGDEITIIFYRFKCSLGEHYDSTV